MQTDKHKKQQKQRRAARSKKQARTTAAAPKNAQSRVQVAFHADTAKSQPAMQVFVGKSEMPEPPKKAEQLPKKPRTAQAMHKERIGTLLSPVVLALSLLVVTLTNAGAKLRSGLCELYYTHLYHRLDGVRGACEALRHNRLQLISLLTAFGLFLPMGCMLRLGVSVTINGRQLGYVMDESAVMQACREIEQQTSAVTGEPYQLQADISYQVGLVTASQFIAEDTLPDKIVNNIDSLTELALLKVEDTVVGACETVEEIEQALDMVQQLYATDEGENEQIRFLENISVTKARVPATMAETTQNLFDALTETTTTAQYYTVDEDDTMTSIARSHGMYLSDLLAMNPEVVPERMPPGLEILIEAAKPRLSVEVTKLVSYTEEIPYDTIRQKDNTLAEDTVEVVQEGVAGQEEIQSRVVLINGVEESEEILSRTVLSEATDKIISVGTKVTGVGSGKLRNPVPGAPVTSGYKYRWGRMHKGIDLGVSIGTPVHAADSGKVIVSTYSQSGYGYYIIIDHGNGMKTLYGHNSKLVANVGDTVSQGQVIAYSGNTGRSTGPHCHFEVMINNANVDPANYIS